MEATSLKLPDPKFSRHVMDGKMREVFTYDILTDSFVVRWDTLIDNIQYHYIDRIANRLNQQIENKSLMDKKRKDAFEFFTELEHG